MVLPRLADMVARRQPEALAARSQRWAASADNLRNLEESLLQIPGAIARSSPADGEGPCDSVVQSLDFLLRTAAGCLEGRGIRDAEMLVTLTSNHSKAQEAIRRRYELRGTSADGRDSRLDLISLYFRCTFFLHHIAARLQDDIAAIAPQPAH